MILLTPEEIKQLVLSRHRVGDIIQIKKQVESEIETIRIIEFFDNYVRCAVGNFRECFLYWDILEGEKRLEED